MKIKLTGNSTFKVKRFGIVCNTKELLLFNLYGFGLWIEK